MPNVTAESKFQLKLKEQAAQIDLLAQVMTYQERMEVCTLVGVHEDTLTRYRKEVKKMATAAKLIEEMKKIAGDRDAL